MSLCQRAPSRPPCQGQRSVLVVQSWNGIDDCSVAESDAYARPRASVVCASVSSHSLVFHPEGVQVRLEGLGILLYPSTGAVVSKVLLIGRMNHADILIETRKPLQWDVEWAIRTDGLRAPSA